MQRHAVIVVLKDEYRDLEIVRFLKAARAFVFNVRKQQETFDRYSRGSSQT